MDQQELFQLNWSTANPIRLYINNNALNTQMEMHFVPHVMNLLALIAHLVQFYRELHVYYALLSSQDAIYAQQHNV